MSTFLANKQPIVYSSTPRCMLLLPNSTETNSLPGSQTTNIFQTLVYGTTLLKFPRPLMGFFDSAFLFIYGDSFFIFLGFLLNIGASQGLISTPCPCLLTFCWYIPNHISRLALAIQIQAVHH